MATIISACSASNFVGEYENLDVAELRILSVFIILPLAIMVLVYEDAGMVNYILSNVLKAISTAQYLWKYTVSPQL